MLTKHINKCNWLKCMSISIPQLLVTLDNFGYSDEAFLVSLISKIFKLFDFPIFDYKRTWWRWFQKRIVHTKCDIYVYDTFGRTIIRYIRLRYLWEDYNSIYTSTIPLGGQYCDIYVYDTFGRTIIRFIRLRYLWEDYNLIYTSTIPLGGQ